jgi:hypothetical protein
MPLVKVRPLTFDLSKQVVNLILRPPQQQPQLEMTKYLSLGHLLQVSLMQLFSGMS